MASRPSIPLYNRLIYGFVVWALRLLMKIFAPLEVHGDWRALPQEGPVILTANHIGTIDPLLLMVLCPRPVVFMAKEEAFENPFLRFFFHGCRVIPVRRGASDRHALQLAIQVVRRGEVFGIFPEGTRSRTARLQKGKNGVALIALRGGEVPILPIALWGTEKVLPPGGKFPRRARVHVRIAPSVIWPRLGRRYTKKDLDEITDQVMLQIARMLPEEYRGVYADRVRDA